MARPAGQRREALRQAFAHGPGTSAELAERAGISPREAMLLLNNMARGEGREVLVINKVRVPGVKRPVPVYDLLARHGSVAANEDQVNEAAAMLAAAFFGRAMGGFSA
jgi:predicted ArsR family transcriptional regulator